jgi:CheY-like chemotaxis protein/HPt (histidine-containing phosphotransfer) domain-containing protein
MGPVTGEGDLPDLLDQVWRAHRETNLARIDVVERAALGVLQGDLVVSAREAAAADAHKLAGVLGTLGWPQGSVLAMEAESALGGNAPLDAKRLAELAIGLREGFNARDDREASPLAARALGDDSMLELPVPPSVLLDRIDALLAARISTATARAAPAASAAPDVLLVEDDPVLADLLSSALRYRGHRTETVSDGRAALERLDRPEARPRLVILDAYLPGLDGVSVLRGLAERGALERMSVIMLTVRSGEADVLATLRLGAADHIAKPFSLAVLLEKAERLLAN